MPDARYHGLAGKARRARHVSRAHRLYAQQLLEDYLDEDVEPERYIPVRRTGLDFLPSIGPESPEIAFSLVAEPQVVFETLVPPTPDLEASPIVASPELEQLPAVPPPPAAQPVPVLRPRVTLSPVDHCRRRPRRLTPGGFLVGAAMGSAAAAILLLVLQLAVG